MNDFLDLKKSENFQFPNVKEEVLELFSWIEKLNNCDQNLVCQICAKNFFCLNVGACLNFVGGENSAPFSRLKNMKHFRLRNYDSPNDPEWVFEFLLAIWLLEKISSSKLILVVPESLQHHLQ